MRITRRKSQFVDKMFYFVEHEGKFLCYTGEWCNTFDAHDHAIHGYPVTRYGLGYTTKQKLLKHLEIDYPTIFKSIL